MVDERGGLVPAESFNYPDFMVEDMMGGAAKSTSSYARQPIAQGLGSLIGSSLPQDGFRSPQRGRGFIAYSTGPANVRESRLPQAFTHLAGFSHSLVGGERGTGFFYSNQPLRAPPPVLVHGAVSGPAAHVRDLSPAGGRAVSPVRTAMYPVGSLVGPAPGFVRSPSPTAPSLRVRSTSPFPRSQALEAKVPRWTPTVRSTAPKPIPIQEPAGARLRFASPRPARILSRGTTDMSPSAATRPVRSTPNTRPELTPRTDSRPLLLRSTSPRPSPVPSPTSFGVGISVSEQSRGRWCNDVGWQSVQRAAPARRSEGVLRQDERRSNVQSASAGSRSLLRAETAPFKPLGFSFSAPSNDPGSPASLSPLASVAGDPPCSARVIELVEPVPARPSGQGSSDHSPASSCPRRRSSTWRDRSSLEPPRTCGVREWLARKASRSVSPATSDRAVAARRLSDCSQPNGGGGSVVLEAVAREVCPSASPYATPLSTGVRGRYEPPEVGLRGRVGSAAEVPGLQAAALGSSLPKHGYEEMIWTGRKVDNAEALRSGTSSTVDPYRPGEGSSTTGASVSAFRGRGDERGNESQRTGFRCVDPDARQRLFGSPEPRVASGSAGKGPALALSLRPGLSLSAGSEIIRTPIPMRTTPPTGNFEVNAQHPDEGPYSQWTALELKDELGRRGLSSFFCFDRSDLVDRLLQHDKDMRGQAQRQV